MYRFVLTATLLAAVGVLLAGDALAQTDEFELPPVKLKPDRPIKAKPIPPTPDEREVQPPEEPAPPPEPPPAPKEEEPEEPKAPVTPPEPVLPKPAPTPPAEVKPAPVPLKPEKPAEGEAPTPADLPMPEPVVEPRETAPETVALPEREAPPPVMPPVEKPEPRPTDVQSRAIEAQVTPTVQPDLSGMGEVGLVEAVAIARKQYERSLDALRAYYQSRGNNTKIEWVESEIQGFDSIPKVRYLIAAELAGPNLKPTQQIEAADQLYQEGLNFKDYPAFPPGKKDYLKTALEKFRTIIEKYPQSDKIDDAAFRMGEIYGGWYFQDYARAVQSYERCWQWNPDTEHPARFNAAKIFEENLKNRAKAVELYNEVIVHSKNEDIVRQAQERIRALTGR